MTKTALILGATGRFGRNAAEAFTAAGWHVRAFRRGQDDLSEAAQGVDVIVNGWNPAYPRWSAEVPGQTRALIQVAEQTGARVIIPGNVYVYGDQSPEVMRVDTPHAATNPLGRVRVEMEAAWRASSARVTVVRAGDYIDTAATGNWFDKILTAKLGQGIFTYPGAMDQVHAWAFLPDVARACVDLAEQGDALGRYVEMPFAGYSLTGQDLGEAVAAAVGQPLRLQTMSWAPLRVAGLVSPLMRCLQEMRYLWNMPHRLDPGPMRDILPVNAVTPLSDALRQAVPQRPVQAAARQTIYVGRARIV